MAFQVLAPQHAASTSYSKKCCYDVFINHRGKDVKRNLASTIYHSLDLMGVQAFLDKEELEWGDSFPQAIEEAMRTASVHVAIFSPSYAESPWCLEELSLMLKMNVTIIPVFNGVDPSDLRYVAKGKYADAFRLFKTKRGLDGNPRYSPEKIKEWEEALSRASSLTGAIPDNDTPDDDKWDEGKLLRKIVETTLLKMKKAPLEVATFPVGLDKAVLDFEEKVGSCPMSENVHIVGIFGMGGSGKTTLAKELFNRKCSSMSRSSFLCNVRDAATKESLHVLQKQLLDDLHIQQPTFHDKDQGIALLAKALTSMTLLIVLDDVDNVDQMRALLPPKPNLGGGSLIIVTTRDVEVLTSSGISSIYPMKLLDHSNSKELFSKHAFLQPYSHHGLEQLAENSQKFQNLIERFVKACHGLPLSLKVFGAMVNNKAEDYWESQLQKVSRILPGKIADCLKVSYDALDSEEQKMFLDVACFFIGEEKSLAVTIWDGSGWSGEVGWQTLVNKCLIGLDMTGNIEMHDHLRDLGREIAEKVSPSRIWKEEQLRNHEGRAQIRGIVLKRFTNYWSTLQPCPWSTLEPSSLRALELLSVTGDYFTEEFAALPRGLVWLNLWNFKGTNLPSGFSLAKLSVLQLLSATNLKELCYDSVQFQRLPQLREMEELLDLTTLVSLRKLELTNTGLKKLSCNLGQLPKLETLYIEDAENLKELWQGKDNVQHLSQLREMIIIRCPQLEELPDLTTLVSLRKLKLSYTGLKKLSCNIGQLPKLETLLIYNALNLKELWQGKDNVQHLSQLREMIITHCPQLEEWPDLTTLVSLRKLELTITGLKKLSCNIGQLPKLETLLIYDAENLKELWQGKDNVQHLSQLRKMIIAHCPQLEELPDLTTLVSLRKLELTNTGLKKLSSSIGQLPQLETLDINDSCNIEELLQLPLQLRELMFRGPRVRELPNNVGQLSKLETLVIGSNDLNLTITRCERLESLPEAFGRGLGMGSPSGCNLKSLKILKLQHTGVRRISISDDCCPT